MMLSPEQIIRINQKIRLRRVKYNDICAEMTDHIACKIEAELKNEIDFERLLHKTMMEVNPRKFQRNLLIQANLNAVKEFFGNIGDLRLVVKSIAMTFIIGSFINLFSKNTPEFAETALKSAFSIAYFLGFILILWANKYIRNSRLLTTGTVFFFIATFSQFFLKLERLAWTGASNHQLLFFMTACFSFILCSGYANLFRQFKKLKTA
ncbi:hypothetical protein SAMN03080617_00552 [Algoriphagus alkaliphilus]|uniref:Uncharacterized protein n=2 Tax=Algoriphagus alkaliphilus TaxID=279824 RepID=A0A1G5VLJ8_9BACT|nr:hypothetical protein SAMN03080617_00552 [Algoriphagus alkaliphilus]